MKTFLIDGYNLLHQAPGLAGLTSENLEEQRERLIRRLVSLSAGRKLKLHLVFDTSRARGGRTQDPGIRVDFAKPSADAYIRKVISKNQSNRNLIIVSSDRKDIGLYAKTCGIEWMTSRQFWDWLEKRSAKECTDPADGETEGTPPPGWTAEDTARLLRVFNGSDGDNESG